MKRQLLALLTAAIAASATPASAAPAAEKEKNAKTDRGTTAPAKNNATPAKSSPAKPVAAPVATQPPATPAPTIVSVPATPPSAPAATAPGPAPLSANDTPAQMAGDFFTSLSRGQIDDAYATLTKGSKTIEKPEDLRILKQKTREAVEVFGSIVGYELVETRWVGSKLMRRTYLSLGDEYPLRWRFYFYEAKGRWRLIDLRVDDRLAGMFDEPKETEDKSEKP